MENRFGPLSPFFSRRFFDDYDFDRRMMRPYWMDQSMLTGHRIGDAVDVIDNDKEFSVSVDVSQFEPEELKVNIVENQLIIEGKHEEKADKFGQIQRHFVRKYKLPSSARAEEIKSELGSNGILNVKFEKSNNSQAKSIPIKIVATNQ